MVRIKPKSTILESNLLSAFLYCCYCLQINRKMYVGLFSAHNNAKRATRFRKNTIKATNLKPKSVPVSFFQALIWHKVEVSSCLCSRDTNILIIPYF